MFHFMWQNTSSNWSNKLHQRNMWNMWWIGSIFSLKIETINVTKKLHCKSYKYVKNETKLGKETKRLEYVEEELPIITFMDRIKNLSQPYICHAFFGKWQAQQFQTLRDNFLLGTIVSVIDFVKNYYVVHQKKIQSYYFFSK